MSAAGTLRFVLQRGLGRAVTRLAAILTLEKMPPFVSTSAVVIHGGYILTVLDPVRGEPVLPGGHLTWREAPPDGCARETREETGLEVAVGRLVGVYAGEDRAGEGGIVRIVYRATVIGGSLRSSAEGQAGWMMTEEFIRVARRDGAIVQDAVALSEDGPVFSPTSGAPVLPEGS